MCIRDSPNPNQTTTLTLSMVGSCIRYFWIIDHWIMDHGIDIPAPSTLSGALYVYTYIAVLGWKFNGRSGGWIQMCMHTVWTGNNCSMLMLMMQAGYRPADTVAWQSKCWAWAGSHRNWKQQWMTQHKDKLLQSAVLSNRLPAPLCSMFVRYVIKVYNDDRF